MPMLNFKSLGGYFGGFRDYSAMLNNNLPLLNCIGASLRGTLSKDDIQKLSETIVEWDELLDEVQNSGTSALFYYILEASEVDGLLPEQVMKKLQVSCYSNAARNIHYYRELSEVLSYFQRRGVKAIVLKGAALAKTLYSDLSLRPFADIDLLIKDQDFAEANGILELLGYTMIAPKNEFQNGYVRRFDKHILYIKYGLIDVNIEIHTSLLPFISMQKLEADGLWERGVVFPICGSWGLVLSPEDMLLHLCIHIFNHNLSNRLLWLYDVALIILKYEKSLNWKLLERRTRVLGVHRVVGLVLDHVIRKFDMDIPQDIVPWLEVSRLGSLEKYLLANGLGLAAWRYTLRFRQEKGGKNKLAFVFGRLLPSRDYVMQKYSFTDTKLSFLKYCYYCLHAFLDQTRTAFILVFKRMA